MQKGDFILKGGCRLKKTLKILIADDSTSFRKGMRALLDIQMDMEVVGEASDGDKTMQMIGETKPDLILLDAQMPGMTGVEVTRQIKERWPQVNVVLMTMYADYRPKAIEAGADAFVTKGIPPKHLLSILRGIS
jgi:DNA-binding NarL/FixJ family response regulator